MKVTAVDLFCGAGGLTRGLLDARVNVVAGYDIAEECRFPYEQNNAPAKFYNESVDDLRGDQLAKHFGKKDIRVLVGCAPCVPFSRYTQRYAHRRDPKWSLLREFARLICEVQPDIVSMENVPDLQRHHVFDAFLSVLSDEGFYFFEDPEGQIIYCPDYGMAQHRCRLVLVASRFGPIELIPPTHRENAYRTVADVLKSLAPLTAGEVCQEDPLHRASGLSSRNLRRIRHSTPGGTWRDWPPSLVAECHKNATGKTYPAVYGRMEWDEPAPTITTQFFGFGNGRFGHPEEDRAISLREGAMLQSFPKKYQFVPPNGKYHFRTIGRMIGNAVPVRLGKIVGRTIMRHVKDHAK